MRAKPHRPPESIVTAPGVILDTARRLNGETGMKQQPPIPPEAEFVQPKVLAPILGISSATLRRMALKGQVPYVKAGDCYLFPIKTILQDWHEQARKATRP